MAVKSRNRDSLPAPHGQRIRTLKSLKTNIALVENNARLAARIAGAL